MSTPADSTQHGAKSTQVFRTICKLNKYIIYTPTSEDKYNTIPFN
jgi:hypothetical protein